MSRVRECNDASNTVTLTQLNVNVVFSKCIRICSGHIRFRVKTLIKPNTTQIHRLHKLHRSIAPQHKLVDVKIVMA